MQSAPMMQHSASTPQNANMLRQPENLMYPASGRAHSVYGQPIVVRTALMSSSAIDNYAGRTAKVLGYIHIVCAILAIVLHSAAIIMIIRLQLLIEARPVFLVASGIWGGIIFIFAGASTVMAGSRRTRCCIIASLVLSISAAVAAALHFIVSLIAVVILTADAPKTSIEFYRENKVLFGLACCLALGAVVEMVVSIWSSILPCKAACCSAPTSPEIVEFHYTDAPHGRTARTRIGRVSEPAHVRGPAQRPRPMGPGPRKHMRIVRTAMPTGNHTGQQDNGALVEDLPYPNDDKTMLVET